jgi:hypothetical protein
VTISTLGWPCSQSARLAAVRSGEQVDGSASIGIHQDRAVALAAPLAPVIHAQHARRSHRRQWRPLYQPQQGCSTRHQAVPASQPCPSLSAHDTREIEQMAL